MEQQSSNTDAPASTNLQDEWRASIRSFYGKHGFSEESDKEVTVTLRAVSGHELKPSELTKFLQGAAIEQIMAARSPDNDVKGALPFQTNQEKALEIQQAGNEMAGCSSLIGLIIMIGVLGYGVYFFFFSETAKFFGR